MPLPATEPLAAQKKAMIEKHLGLIRQAAKAGAQIVCLQEIFNGPYFCAEQSVKWYETTERVPDGPTVTLMRSLAKELAHRDGCAGLRSRAGRNFLQHRRGHSERRLLSRQISQDAYPARRARVSGRSFISGPAILGIRFSIWALPKSACTSAMTVIFPRARVAWD